MSYGIPIGPPSQRPEPKSACTPVFNPIERIIVAEFAATGSLSTRRFQAFEAGKTGQRGAEGRRSACAEPARPSTSATETATRSFTPRVSASVRPALELGLVRALGVLKALERLGRVDVAERRVVRNELLRGLNAEALREHRAERGHLHPPEAGERRDPPAQLVSAAGLGPDPRRVAAVVLRDDDGEIVDALGHRAREAVHGRLLAE